MGERLSAFIITNTALSRNNLDWHIQNKGQIAHVKRKCTIFLLALRISCAFLNTRSHINFYLILIMCER